MTEKTFTIVAFRYDQKNSIFYRSSENAGFVADLVAKVLYDLKADVISIRRVYDVCPIPKENNSSITI